MLNSNSQLITRLLRIYPIHIIKEFYHLKGNFNDIIPTIIANNTQKSIFGFASSHINYTRQHIHIYNLKPTFKGLDMDPEKFPLPVRDWTNQGGELIINCMPQVDFDVIVTKEYEETTISFFQPVKIKALGSKLIIQVTTLEKNLSHFFAGDRRVVDSVRKNGEDVWLPKILSFFEVQKYKVSTCDLHKGIKKVWDDNVIDSKYVQSLNAKSTSTEAMHEDYTVREVYPDKYNEIIKNPLIKTLFKYRGKDEKLPQHFHVDPAQGLVIFSAFPANNAQSENLINELLKYN